MKDHKGGPRTGGPLGKRKIGNDKGETTGDCSHVARAPLASPRCCLGRFGRFTTSQATMILWLKCILKLHQTKHKELFLPHYQVEL